MAVNSIWKGVREKITQRKGCFVLSLETKKNQSKLNNNLIMGSQYHSPEKLGKNFQKSIDPWVLFLSSNLLLLMSFLNIWPRTWKQTLEQEEIRPLKCQWASAMQGSADKDPGLHVADAPSQAHLPPFQKLH